MSKYIKHFFQVRYHAIVRPREGRRFMEERKFREAAHAFAEAAEAKYYLASSPTLAVAECLNLLAAAQRGKGDYVAAEEAMSRSVDILKELKPNSDEVPVSLNNLAILMQSQGKFDLAREKFHEALAHLDSKSDDVPSDSADAPDRVLITVNAANNELKVAAKLKHADALEHIATAERLVRGAVAMRWSALPADTKSPTDEPLANALEVLASALAARFRSESAMAKGDDSADALLTEAICCLDDAIDIQGRILGEAQEIEVSAYEEDGGNKGTPVRKDERLKEKRNALDRELSALRKSAAHIHWGASAVNDVDSGAAASKGGASSELEKMHAFEK